MCLSIRQAEDNRQKENQAAIRIQSWFRACKVRAYLRYNGHCMCGECAFVPFKSVNQRSILCLLHQFKCHRKNSTSLTVYQFENFFFFFPSEFEKQELKKEQISRENLILAQSTNYPTSRALQMASRNKCHLHSALLSHTEK